MAHLAGLMFHSYLLMLSASVVLLLHAHKACSETAGTESCELSLWTAYMVGLTFSMVLISCNLWCACFDWRWNLDAISLGVGEVGCVSLVAVSCSRAMTCFHACQCAWSTCCIEHFFEVCWSPSAYSISAPVRLTCLYEKKSFRRQLLILCQEWTLLTLADSSSTNKYMRSRTDGIIHHSRIFNAQQKQARDMHQHKETQTAPAGSMKGLLESAATRNVAAAGTRQGAAATARRHSAAA